MGSEADVTSDGLSLTWRSKGPITNASITFKLDKILPNDPDFSLLLHLDMKSLDFIKPSWGKLYFRRHRHVIFGHFRNSRFDVHLNNLKYDFYGVYNKPRTEIYGYHSLEWDNLELPSTGYFIARKEPGYNKDFVTFMFQKIWDNEMRRFIVHDKDDELFGHS